jgi:hypothetical protein
MQKDNLLENTLSCKIFLYAGWNCAGSGSFINDLDEKMNFSEHIDVRFLVRFLRCWDLSDDCHLSLEIHTFWGLSTRLSFARSWSTPAVYVAHSLFCSISCWPVISLWIASGWLWRPTQLFVFLRINCALNVLLYMYMVPATGWNTQWTLLSLHQLIVVTGIIRYLFLFYFICICMCSVFEVLSITKIVS